jgi:phospholipid/cholesterol/gamma-HCH transport system ATP-binding protein
MNVAENVKLPLRELAHLDEKTMDIMARLKLEVVNMSGFGGLMPAELSGGMRKRAALARAMALDPPILLVDEPSAGLDPITTSEIDDLLVKRKRAGTTLVVVTHNIPSARRIGDELALLHDGRIVAQGTVNELDRAREPLVQAFMQSEGGG